MKIKSLLATLFFTVIGYLAHSQATKIPREPEQTLPSQYPNGLYYFDTEQDTGWNWPLDASPILGVKPIGQSNFRHSQLILGYNDRVMFRGKDGNNDAWRPWRNLAVLETNGGLNIKEGILKMTTTGTARQLRLFSAGNVYNTYYSGILSFNLTTNNHLDYPSSKGSRFVFHSHGALSFQQSDVGSGARTLTSAFYIDSDAKIGIGTTSPTALLSVAGTMDAQEIKVEVGAGTAPDYVFADDYELSTLEETASYIEENHHLPEIPSAKEMEANGLNLGEMNMLLLKKIEELTLHQIEQHKKIETLTKEVNKLKLK